MELPDRVGLLSWKVVGPVMAQQLDGPGRGLNILSREALAAATVLNASVRMAASNHNLRLAADLHEIGLHTTR